MPAGRWSSDSPAGDVVVPDDGELPGLPGDLGRHHAHRRNRLALNTHLIGDSLAHAMNVVAPRHVIVGAEFARGLYGRAAPRLIAADSVLGTWAGPTRAAAHRCRYRQLLRRAAHGALSARCRALPIAPLHLHLRHHRLAQGCQRQPFSTDAVEPLVRRASRHAPDRPNVQLPAHVPQRRRRRCDRRDAGQRRVGVPARRILGTALLG